MSEPEGQVVVKEGKRKEPINVSTQNNWHLEGHAENLITAKMPVEVEVQGWLSIPSL